MKEKNKIEVVGSELLIYVDSPKYGRQIIIADADEFEKLAQYRWRVNWDNHTKSFYTKTSVRKEDGKWTNLPLHRLVMNATDSKTQVDHKNRNTLDNRKSNLQLCSSRENCQNRSKKSNNSSGYFGVNFHKNTGKFQAQIMNNDGKKLHLGLYLDPYSAALAYVAAKMVIHSNLVSWQLPTCAEGLLTIDAFISHLEAVRDNPGFQRQILNHYGYPEFASALSKIDFSTTKLFTESSLQEYKEVKRRGFQ